MLILEFCIIKMLSQLARWQIQFVWIMEIIAVLHYLSLFIAGNLIAIPIFIFLLSTPPLFVLPFVYLIWMYFDYSTPFRKGRRMEFVRRLFIWRYLASYFPIKLHKTTDLDPTKNYLFCFHPHGILSISCFVNFATEVTGFSYLFPGLIMHLCTLNINFQLPLFREYAIACDLAPVEKHSIRHKLSKLGEGHSVAIVTGGAAEAELADPKNPYVVKLIGRRGFVREALKAGANLVPVFSFGESEIFYLFKAKPGSFLERIQKIGRRCFGVAPLVFYGQFGLLPYRKKINTVVGSPLEIPRIESPTDEDINLWHSRYVEAVKELFANNKGKYGLPNKELEIV